MDTTLVSFLTARIDEDEAVTEVVAENVGGNWQSQGRLVRAEDGGTVAMALNEGLATFLVANSPARGCREVEVRRWVVATYQRLMVTAHDEGADPGARAVAAAGAGALYLILLAMADIYSDHPDYDPTWPVTRRTLSAQH